VSLTKETVMTALATVQDPEIRRPITEIGMVKNVEVADLNVQVDIYLTVEGCPLRQEIVNRVTNAVKKVDEKANVKVDLDVMNDAQRKKLREQLRGPVKENPFSSERNLTRVYAIASGKGGVGKSSITANLGIAFSKLGLSVGILDADIYGHSIPRIMGVTNAPTVVEGMIMPQLAHGLRVISMLAFKPGGVTQPIAFRGPMLHKAVEQFMTDVWWGDLDVLLLDLPPGTGDVAISVAQLVPKSEIIVITTPQIGAAEVAVRSGTLAKQTHQRVVGVIENMSGVICPKCGEIMDLFGKGGGDNVAKALTNELGTEVKVLGKVPFDVKLREGADDGKPLILSDPESLASKEIMNIANSLVKNPKGLVGKNLGLLTN
jgi:ATP-binding protein involved in chromosome partitioning